MEPNQKRMIGFILLICLMIGGYFLLEGIPSQQPSAFNGQRAYSDLKFQVNLGPRIPDSVAHKQVLNWAETIFKESGWTTFRQDGLSGAHSYINLTATRGQSHPWIIVGAHYDSRLWADQDPDPLNRKLPVPGANDGASGVAILTEMARDLPTNPDRRIDLVLLDAEDNGNIQDWDWILGSKEYTKSLVGKPDAVIILDMVGDKDLNIYREKNSTPSLVDAIWKTAKQLGYDEQFINEEKYSMLDDHTPFLEQGIPAVDVIDFDYPYWHTTQDTLDKTSPESLTAVGATILKFVTTYQAPVTVVTP